MSDLSEASLKALAKLMDQHAAGSKAVNGNPQTQAIIDTQLDGAELVAALQEAYDTIPEFQKLAKELNSYGFLFREDAQRDLTMQIVKADVYSYSQLAVDLTRNRDNWPDSNSQQLMLDAVKGCANKNSKCYTPQR